MSEKLIQNNNFLLVTSVDLSDLFLKSTPVYKFKKEAVIFKDILESLFFC